MTTDKPAHVNNGWQRGCSFFKAEKELTHRSDEVARRGQEMFGPDHKAGCPSCSSIAKGFNGFDIHLANHDVMLWAVSGALLGKLQIYISLGLRAGGDQSENQFAAICVSAFTLKHGRLSYVFHLGAGRGRPLGHLPMA